MAAFHEKQQKLVAANSPLIHMLCSVPEVLHLQHNLPTHLVASLRCWLICLFGGSLWEHLAALYSWGHISSLFSVFFTSRYNNYDRAVINTVPYDVVHRWYTAHRTLTAELRRPENELWVKLKPGKVGLRGSHVFGTGREAGCSSGCCRIG